MPIITYDIVSNADDFAGGMNNAAAATLGVVGAITAATTAGKALLDNVFGRVDQINTWSAATGLSVETVNALAGAARKANKDVGQLIPQGFAKRMKDVADNTGEANKAVRSLIGGVEDGKGSIRDANDLFRDLLGEVLAIEDPLLRAALAEQIFGENGREMLSAFNDIEGFDSFMVSAGRWGTSVGPEATQRSNEWWAATESLNVAFEDVADTIANVVAPVASALVEGFATGIVYVEQLLLQSTNFVVKRFATARQALEQWREGLISTGEAVDMAFLNPAEGIREFIQIISLAKGNTQLFWTDVVKGANQGTEAVGEFSGEIDEVGVKLSGWFLAISKEAEAMRLKAERDTVRLLEEIARQTDTTVGEIERAADAADAAGDRMLEQAEALAQKQREIAQDTVGSMATSWTAYFQTLAELRTQDVLEDEQATLDRLRRNAEVVANKESSTDAEVRFAQEAADRQAKIANKEVLDAFNQQQNWARGQAAINTAIAFTAMVANLSPFLGPFAVPTAAATTVPMLNLQLAEINAAKPPTVRHGGGFAPDEVATGGLRALAGEGVAVLNRQAMANGAADRVAAENQRRSSSAGPTQLVLSGNSGRTLAVALLAEMNTPGSAAMQATNGEPRGFVNPYRST